MTSLPTGGEASCKAGHHRARTYLRCCIESPSTVEVNYRKRRGIRHNAVCSESSLTQGGAARSEDDFDGVDTGTLPNRGFCTVTPIIMIPMIISMGTLIVWGGGTEPPIGRSCPMPSK